MSGAQKRKSVRIAEEEDDSRNTRSTSRQQSDGSPVKKKSDVSTGSLPVYLIFEAPASSGGGQPSLAQHKPQEQHQPQEQRKPQQQPQPVPSRRHILSVVRRNRRRRRQERFGPIVIRDRENKDRVEVKNIEGKEKLLQNKAWQITADALRDEKEAYIIFALRDFIIYLIFLFLLLTVSYGPNENAYNYYASVLSDMVTKSKFATDIEYGNAMSTVNRTFEEIRSIRQLWDFINKIFVTVIYMDPIRNKILLESYLIGMPSIRLMRVRNDTCSTAPMFQDLYKTCYNEYSADIEDKEPFGELISYPWGYTPAFRSERAYGLKATYTSGGYILNFTLDRNFTVNWLTELESNNWIGPGTRAVVIDFTLYTPNTNLFLVVKLLAEVLPEGGVITSHSFLTHKFMRYVIVSDYFVMSCEVLFLIFTIYFTMEELQQIWLLRNQYLSNWWNVLDLMIIVLSYALVFTGIKRFQINWDNLGDKILQVETSNHASFDDILLVNETFMIIDSFLTFLVWLKLFKFATLFRSVILILASIEQVKYELGVVTFILVIIVIGFSLLGYTLFGSHVDQYHGITHSFFSVISMFVGRLYYIEELRYAQGETHANMFVGTFSLVVGIYFLSTYLALVVYGYQQTHLAQDDGGILDQQFMHDLVYSLYINILTFFRLNNLVSSYRAKDQSHRNKADYDAFVTMLKRYGWDVKEINLLLRAFGLRRGLAVTLDGLTKIYNDFWLRNELFIEVQAHDEIRDQLNKIEKTLEWCELSIVDIMSKTDVIADKAMKQSMGSK